MSEKIPNRIPIAGYVGPFGQIFDTAEECDLASRRYKAMPPPIQHDLLLMAEIMTRRVLGYRRLFVGRLQRVALQARIYDVLAGRRAEGTWPLEANEITSMEDLLRRGVQNGKAEE